MSFRSGYESMLLSSGNTAFVVLTPHCGAKFVQCETGLCEKAMASNIYLINVVNHLKC